VEAAKVSREGKREVLRDLLLDRAIETVEEIGGRLSARTVTS